MAQIDALADSCGYTNYSATHVTFPPKGPLPLPGKSVEGDRGCRVWDQIFDAALLVNPAFDIYRIFDTVSALLTFRSYILVLKFCSIRSCGTFSVSREYICILYKRRFLLTALLRSGSFPETQVSPLYFDRQDVKVAIHAPTDVTWTECSDINVFPRGDASQPSGLTVLPNIIEKSERSVIVHGLADYILIAEG